LKFVTYRDGAGLAKAGILSGNTVVDLAAAGFPDLISVAARGGRIGAIPEDGGTDLSRIQLLAPVPRPPKFICVGLNYRDHAIESGMPIPERPTVFSKFSSCVIGPGAPIVLPRNSVQPDYEAEFAFVIGKGGRHIRAENWRDHVFGYTIVNDVSARDFQMATSQWLMGKTFDTFGPMGPWLVSADEIPDPHSLDITLIIGGETLQSSNTRELIFKIPDLIAYISSVVTLEPGDIVSTGTPSGVGFARKPPRYLKPGDEVVIRIDGIGELRNPVVAEA
jgi:2-keto-4-pentenoate hydratase/2-oxohepta-3-ene-1,7-dioic acid hydratase in catechol pathway